MDRLTQQVLEFDKVKAYLTQFSLSALGRTHIESLSAITDIHKIHTHRKTQPSRGDRTVTRVERLSQDERVMEIARMLGGEKITDTTLRHAKEMIESSK